MKGKEYLDETDLKSLDLDVLLKMTIECIREIQARKKKIHDFIGAMDQDLSTLIAAELLPPKSDQ